MATLEAIPSSNYRLEDLMLPNGELVVNFLRQNDPAFLDKQLRGGRIAANGPQTAKNQLVAYMTTVAHKLCDITKLYPKGRYFTEPEQHGLAYSFGQRDYSTRALPPSGECQKYSLYGLDCSGLLYNVLKESGYHPRLPITAEMIRQVSFWTSLLQTDPDLAKVKVKDLGPIPLNQFQPGDIVYWKKEAAKPATHIGVVLIDKTGRKAIFQSNGTDLAARNCIANFAPNRGCHQIPIDAVNWKNGFGKIWSVVRIVTDITGKWEMQFKCDWAKPTDIAVNFDIEFKMSENDNAVTGKGTGRDYDHKPLDVTFKGSFDQATNVLKGRFYIIKLGVSTIREDDLTIALAKDDTGFVTLTSIIRDSDTCISQVRLINKTSGGGRMAANETVKITRQNLF